MEKTQNVRSYFAKKEEEGIAVAKILNAFYGSPKLKVNS
jgi:hypothetical protein